MKKIIIAMAAIAAAFTMASCNKEQPVSPIENPTVGKSVITASIENGITKATLEGNDDEGYSVVWTAGDQLFVGDSQGTDWCAKYTLDNASAGSSKGAFIWQRGDYFNSICEEYEAPVFKEGKRYVAMHPFDLVDENNNEYLIWKTEQTYDETDIYIPMFGEAKCTEDGAADFTFTNLGGLLRLNVKGTATIKSIKVQAQEPMSGHILYFGEDDKGYKVAFISDYAVLFTPNTKNYINLNCGENGVKLRPEGTDFYISMPCRYNAKGEDMADFDGYSDVTITLTDTDGKTCVKKLNNKKLFIERSKITTASFTASEFKSNVPEGALPGKFSVSADKQVYFSQGNLYYDGSAFKFEDNQYDFQSSWNANHVNHFYWVNSVEEAVKEGYDEETPVCSKDDIFFTNGTAESAKSDFIVNGVTGKYRTLTKEEWQYLINERKMTNENASYTLNITYGEKVGLVIYPDDFNGSTLTPGFEYTEDTFPSDCVFLPLAGYRDNNGFASADVFGEYWSSSICDFEEDDAKYDAYHVIFSSLFVDIDLDGRQNGYSVRLVTDCE